MCICKNGKQNGEYEKLKKGRVVKLQIPRGEIMCQIWQGQGLQRLSLIGYIKDSIFYSKSMRNYRKILNRKVTLHFYRIILVIVLTINFKRMKTEDQLGSY